MNPHKLKKLRVKEAIEMPKFEIFYFKVLYQILSNKNVENK